MGMGGGGGGSGKVKSDINVTPLVDIVLVMLIIFLVAMPIVMRKIDIEIPKKIEDPPVDIVLPDQVTIEVTKAGIILLNAVEVPRAQLAVKLRERLEHKRDKAVFVDFDENTRYGDAVQIMDAAKGAGATTIAMKIKDVAGPGQPGAPGGQTTPEAPATPPNP
jgi:biopolymer transport protein TolR